MIKDKVLHIYIGEDDVQEWTQGGGKDVLMPAMYECCKTIIEKDLKKLQFARVEAKIRKRHKAFDFWVEADGIWDTLEKLMEWALEEEKYELCSDIKKLEEQLDKQNEF